VTSAVELDLGGLRGAAVAMLAAGAALPLLPGHAGLSCPLRAVTGVPCPLCGASTSVEATLHGHPLEAVGANPLGPFVVAAALVVAIRKPRHAVRVPLLVFVVAAALLWAFQLRRFGQI
jgi:hypothetical protein